MYVNGVIDGDSCMDSFTNDELMSHMYNLPHSNTCLTCMTLCMIIFMLFCVQTI